MSGGGIHRSSGIAIPVGVASGGTGAMSLPAGAVLLGNGTTAVTSFLTTAGRVLLGNGASGVTDDAGLTYNSTTDKLTVNGEIAQNAQILTLDADGTSLTSAAFIRMGTTAIPVIRVSSAQGSAYIGDSGPPGGGFGTGVGNFSAGGAALSSLAAGNSNFGLGDSSLLGLTIGDNNVGIATASGQSILDGDFNVCIGYLADVTLGNAQSRIVIGPNASGDTDNQVFFGAGTVTAWVPGAADVATLGRADREFQGLYLANGVNAVAGTAATINAATGRFLVSATTVTFTLTNSRIAVGDTVLCQPAQNDATGRVVAVVPGIGSATIHLVAPTANMSCQFLIVKN